MALEPGPNALSGSPESSGRDSPAPRQWRNQLGGGEAPIKDKAYRRYAVGVEKALVLFETTLEEWADYISFLNRVLKALQARPSSFTTIPAKATVAKRLSQCLNPSLPSGVHQKTLEVYNYVFDTIGKDGLARDLPLYLPGLAPTLSFASLSVRSPFLELLEKHFVGLDARSLRPAMRSIIMALLPGLEDETSEDFDRTLHLVASFKKAVRPADHRELADHHSTGDDFFWQCFFLATITSYSRRSGALAYLTRFLPSLGSPGTDVANADEKTLNEDLSKMVTTPEPGLLIRCFASGLADDQILIQRGFLDLLVSHLPLDSTVLQSNVKAQDLELLLKAATQVVTRRDMSLNRRLWAWLLGPEPTIPDTDQPGESNSDQQQALMVTRTKFFEEYGLQALTRALLDMINSPAGVDATERARPYRICLSLMDRWEIGGLVVPEIFLPIIESVQQFKKKAATKSEFEEVLRSASVFFDGIESGLIYSELVGLLAQAIGPGSLSTEERKKKLTLTSFIIANFNVREEEMVTVHAPLTCLAALYMLDDAKSRRSVGDVTGPFTTELEVDTFRIVSSLLELVPERAFPVLKSADKLMDNIVQGMLKRSTVGLLKKIRDFYVHEQGNLDSSKPPFSGHESGQLLLYRAAKNVFDTSSSTSYSTCLDTRVRIFLLVLTKVSPKYYLDSQSLLAYMKDTLSSHSKLPFSEFASILLLATQLFYADRISIASLSSLIPLLVGQAWRFLSISEPKYHVEAVRCLWQLQTALTPARRDVEAALSTLLVDQTTDSHCDAARVFGVLWSHTLQDTQSERRSSRGVIEFRAGPRLAGADVYEVMLTQPLFLVLDSLLDDRTQEHMTVKSWLHTMIGIDRLLLLIATKLTSLPYLDVGHVFHSDEEKAPVDRVLSEDDDVALGLYYLRTLHHVLQYSGDSAWVVLATKHVTVHEQQMHISAGGEEGALPLQEYLVHACVRCITAVTPKTADNELSGNVAQLQRYALKVLRQFLASRFASSLTSFHLETVLVERLWRSLEGQDAHIQVLLLDVIYDTLKLQDATLAERPTSPVSERWRTSVDKPRPSQQSASFSESRPISWLPPQLLKCLTAGLSSPNSHQVLDSWVTFLGACLPLYSGSIFQILIPLVETLCREVDATFANLVDTFKGGSDGDIAKVDAPESTLIHLLNGLEQVLARAHDQILADEARIQLMKSPDQPQSLFGSMVSGVFQSDSPQSRSATANDRLTVHLAIQDAVRICYRIWSWGEGHDASKIDTASAASFNYTSLRMRNRARRLLEHLFVAEALECQETVVDIWNNSSDSDRNVAFSFLASLEASRPRQTIPSLFNAIYSRTNPAALEPSRKSTLTISLRDVDLVVFLVHYTRSLDDDAMDEIWQDCITFIKDILANPFPHRQTLPGLLEFASILGAKVDNTNFGEQRKMRRELGDLFLRLLAALFTARPITFTESSSASDKVVKNESRRSTTTTTSSTDKNEDIMDILTSVVPSLPKVLPEPDRVLSAAGTVSASVIGPTIRSKIFPDSVTQSTMKLLHELSKLQNNQKTWKKDVGDAFNDTRFFGMHQGLAKDDWLPLLKQWIFADKEKMPEIVGRITAPTTAGIVFGVGATSARLEADHKTQLNLRRIATLILACNEDAFMTDLPIIVGKLVELLAASSTSSPSSATRADIYMVIRALVLRTSPMHLSVLWPIVNAEIHAAVSSVVAPDSSTASDTYTNVAVFQACKLLDLLICMAPDDFQLHEWLFITDNIDAVYRSATAQPVALVDEISEELGSAASYSGQDDSSLNNNALTSASGRPRRRPLLGPGGISEQVSLERKDELIAKVLRPFFGQLSIFAFESVYAMGPVDTEACVEWLLRDLFDERTMVKSL